MSANIMREKMMFMVTWEWLSRGWQLFKQAALLNITYAALFLLIGLAVGTVLLHQGFSIVYFIAAGGFLIVVPGLVAVYYHLAEVIQRGDKPGFADILDGVRECPLAIMVLGLVSLVIYLIWITDALIIYSVYFDFVPTSLTAFGTDPALRADVAAFLVFVSLLGFVLSFITFCITVFSIPYAVQKQCGLVDAVSFSVKTVTRHSRLMFFWAAVLGGLTFFTVLFALPLLLVVLPILAYANYATYNDMLRLMESK
ncbi:DUF2189 domain-containing protein [Sedimenticola thiotaurini]|uniref:DUF2189 domain-containing protein n=1 Tax=Sedimenticola thiotaurini TaxID=1543721 RepID=A0A0F7JUK9_9GAMM|nr:DUF2189 domain-containing protein [Sedimenticola thiotaurini]AKH20251.1 hypothetical protein AAY24_07705 [Sedimenticola thiotaurini]